MSKGDDNTNKLFLLRLLSEKTIADGVFCPSPRFAVLDPEEDILEYLDTFQVSQRTREYLCFDNQILLKLSLLNPDHLFDFPSSYLTGIQQNYDFFQSTYETLY